MFVENINVIDIFFDDIIIDDDDYDINKNFEITNKNFEILYKKQNKIYKKIKRINNKINKIYEKINLINKKLNNFGCLKSSTITFIYYYKNISQKALLSKWDLWLRPNLPYIQKNANKILINNLLIKINYLEQKKEILKNYLKKLI